jgi:hypothetical protein
MRKIIFVLFVLSFLLIACQPSLLVVGKYSRIVGTASTCHDTVCGDLVVTAYYLVLQSCTQHGVQAECVQVDVQVGPIEYRMYEIGDYYGWSP